MSAVLRSVLYMPSSNERALEKAKTIPADAIIFDLEDAVAPDAKEAARGNAVAAAPPLEADSESATQAERRLRACVSANASGHGTIEAAILHTRAACKPQINDLRDVRIIAVTSGLEPDAA